MPYSDPVTAGNVLIQDAIQSPDFVAGVSGWSINKDGTAEFSDATIRGLLEVVGSSGASITILPGSQPTITFNSPDGTNEAFINLITGAGSQAQLGINSGKFTPADLIPRYWRIFAADDNIVFQVVRESTQATLGGLIRQNSVGTAVGFRDSAAVLFTTLTITDGLVDLVQDTGEPVTFHNAGVVAPLGVLVNRKSNFAQAQFAAETLDTGIGSALPGGSGNTTFTAYTGRTYRVSYRARLVAAAATTTADLRIRTGYDGTAAPPAPTAVSTLLAGASLQLPVAGGPGATTLEAEQTLDCPGDIPAGVHRLGAFYARTAGGATVAVDQSSGTLRELVVHDVGSTA